MSKIKNKVPTIVFLVFIFSLAIVFMVSPKKARSENEKRALASFPKFSVTALSNGDFTSDFEAYLSDHFPFREKWVGLNSYVGLVLGRNGENGIYKGKDGYLITLPPAFESSRVKKNAKVIDKFIDNSNLPASVIIVPTTGYIMGDKLPKNHKEYKDGDVIFAVAKNIKNAEFIDLITPFNENKGDIQIYYKTDHHLTADGSLLVYKEFCKAKNLTESTFEVQKEVDGFYGTCYSKSGLWGEKGDSVKLYKTDSKFTVTISEGKVDKTYNSLYFENHLKENDKYPVYLDGNHAITKIHNENLKNGKRLLVFKDSYSHCFTTFLAENYEDIILVDLRYYKSSVKKLLADENPTELLFMFGSENVSTSTDISWLLM